MSISAANTIIATTADSSATSTGALQVTGGASFTKNVVGGVGTIGPMILIVWSYTDIAVGATLKINEPGAPGTGAPILNFFNNPISGVAEAMNWNKIRFIFRACGLGTGLTYSNNQFQIQQKNYTNATNNVGAQFGGNDGGETRGYVTYVSPWLTGFDVSQFWILLVSSGATTVRIGPVYLQFGYA